MADYSKYLTSVDKYQNKLPSYLQTPGSIIMNTIRLYYDIMDGYRNTIINNVWKQLDINYLLNEYNSWRLANSLADDSDFPYTDFIEKLCRLYEINREHPVDGGTVLRNSHMLRLLKTKISGIGFDGSREKLEELLENVVAGTNISYFVKTRNNSHAEADVYLVKSTSSSNFDSVDEALFNEGYYFLELLGITLNFDTVEKDRLVYDTTVYDTSKYDGGEI